MPFLELFLAITLGGGGGEGCVWEFVGLFLLTSSGKGMLNIHTKSCTVQHLLAANVDGDTGKKVWVVVTACSGLNGTVQVYT